MLKYFNADETERTTVTTSQKRKWSSHSSQVYYSCESTHSKCSKSVAEYHQPVSFDEEDERPERKKRRTDNAEKVSSLLVFDQRGSTGHGQAQQVQAAVPLHEHHTEGKQNILVLLINLTIIKKILFCNM